MKTYQRNEVSGVAVALLELGPASEGRELLPGIRVRATSPEKAASPRATKAALVFAATSAPYSCWAATTWWPW